MSEAVMVAVRCRPFNKRSERSLDDYTVRHYSGLAHLRAAQRKPLKQQMGLKNSVQTRYMWQCWVLHRVLIARPSL